MYLSTRRLIGSALLITMLTALCSSVVLAMPPIDSYADGVDESTSSLTRNRTNALGAPDGNVATVVGVMGADLVLDMGGEEEGTNDLIVHYRQLTLAVVTTVFFLDDQKQPITSGTLTLSQVDMGTQTTIVTYDHKPLPYRYVRFAAVANDYHLDAIEATANRPDSDRDGLPDTWEIQHAINPLSDTGVDGASGDPDGDGLTNAQEYAQTTHPNNSDTDDDGVSDGQEATIGTNPTNTDTDQDGLPDGWEVQHGLNPRDATGDNGASGDPDRDGISNADEYAAGSNPTVSNATPPTSPPAGTMLKRQYLPMMTKQ